MLFLSSWLLLVGSISWRLLHLTEKTELDELNYRWDLLQARKKLIEAKLACIQLQTNLADMETDDRLVEKLRKESINMCKDVLGLEVER